ncbi:hypothetical protein CERZMDRAFT_90335 [Cercospora zeae-maydis SCOH1-5]|uniref:Uncharacterized protein n=1 Tax=Cercospora zeae-maydis SCOH1-5 TaxID=717836 RepID=A0A6A6FLT2_9PEZI|nr:hypothetical protein CERZMDRAFT_90335 [Cercospora zeae-maydis SCOH1-5]
MMIVSSFSCISPNPPCLFLSRPRLCEETRIIAPTLDPGAPLPMRLVHGQGVGGFGYQFVIQHPNGAVAQNPGNQGSGYVVQNSCDRTTAPPFVGAFGQEL